MSEEKQFKLKMDEVIDDLDVLRQYHFRKEHRRKMIMTPLNLPFEPHSLVWYAGCSWFKQYLYRVKIVHCCCCGKPL